MAGEPKDDPTADFDAQGASARPGGEAEGGIAADGAEAARAAKAGDDARREMRQRGFGDHKGAEL